MNKVSSTCSFHCITILYDEGAFLRECFSLKAQWRLNTYSLDFEASQHPGENHQL